MIKRTTLIIMLIMACVASRGFCAAKPLVPNLKPGEDFVAGQLMALSVDGNVFFSGYNDTKWRPVEPGMSFSDGYMVRTGNNGYLVLSWSENNLIYVKPHSGFRVKQTPVMGNKIALEIHHADMMLSARDSGGIVSLEGQNVSAAVVHGDLSFLSREKNETVKAISGEASYRLGGKIKALPAQYFVEVDSKGQEGPLRRHNPIAEYESFKRFSSWMKRYEEFHKSHSDEFYFKLDSIKVNDVFLNEMRKENGMHVLETSDGTIPKNILLQVKINPYPAPHHRIELNLGKGLIYAFREGRNGFHEVNFALPSIPEFIATIQYADSHDRRVSLFTGGFSVYNKRMTRLKAQEFCKELSRAMSRRDVVWLRNSVSDNYRDFMGNERFDFIKSTEAAFRDYRDIRLSLHPFNYKLKDGKIQVRVNYRLSALTSSRNFRYENKGSEILTLALEDRRYKIVSKTGGLFFNQMKTTVDLRQAVLKGRVLDEMTGRPVDGVTVNVVNTTFSAVTDFMGEFIIYNIPPGTYNIRYTKNGFGVITAANVVLTPSGR